MSYGEGPKVIWRRTYGHIEDLGYGHMEKDLRSYGGLKVIWRITYVIWRRT